MIELQIAHTADLDAGVLAAARTLLEDVFVGGLSVPGTIWARSGRPTARSSSTAGGDGNGGRAGRPR